MLIVLRSGVTATHLWIVSVAIETQLTLNILLPIVYFGLWNKINLRFSSLCLFWMARTVEFNIYFMCAVSD